MKAIVASLAIVAALSGCAAQRGSERPESAPATTAVGAEAGIVSDGTEAASSEPTARTEREQEAAPPPAVLPTDAPAWTAYDPWERANRASYRFNARVDEAVLVPVTHAYRRVPAPVRSGIHNFFGNLRELVSIVNYTLQARPVKALRSVGRFAINSTIGLAGFVDVATRLDLKNPATGFGRTLAWWGVRPGPYVVIPILGPSTLRDGIGLFADLGTSYGINLGGLYTGTEGLVSEPFNALDERSGSEFRYYATGSPFEYDQIRFLYVHKRLIEDAGMHRPAATVGPELQAATGGRP